MRFHPAVLALALTAAACAPTSQMPTVDPALARAEAEKQRELAITDRVSELARLRRVADRLLVAGADLCGKRVAWRLGLAVATRDEFDSDFRDAETKKLGMDDRLRALVVVADRPAARAGVQASDALVALEGWKVPRRRATSTSAWCRMTTSMPRPTATPSTSTPA